MSTVAYLLAPIPKWVLINNEGTVAGGAKLFTYRSLNKIQQKLVYQDAGGTIPWTDPIIFDLNGTQGPFYWAVDSADLTDTYYLEAYDADDNLLWTVDNYFPPGTGGGGDVVTYVPITNYITNNQFIDHIDDTANPVNSTNLVIAPSNHKGFTPAAINPIIGTFGTLGPDIRFVKNNTLATDQITFPVFPLASAPMDPTDVTPVDYVRYQCTNGPVGETYKSFQFPITQKVKNLSNQAMTFKIWARVTAVAADISVYVRQYFGSGTAASAEVRTLISPPLTLDTTWTQYNFSFTVPDVAAKTLGAPGLQTDDDALYIQLEMPLGSPCDILFTKPKLYLGTIDPSLDFDTYDQINSINTTPRTGDIRIGLSSEALLGWVPMNDGSIGNIGSNATTRQNQDTFQLYKTIWDGVINTWAPTQNSAGTPVARGGSAVADFLANKRLVLPLSLGRVLGGYGAGAGLTARVLGEYTGAETVTLTAANMPSTVPVNLSGISSSLVNLGASVNVPSNGTTPFTPGSGVGASIMQPTAFRQVFIKL